MVNLARCPILTAVTPLPSGRIRTVVALAAHSGDELCAAGGLLASLAAADARVRVLVVTDEVSDPDQAPVPLGRRRVRLACAYQLLGLDPASRYRLGLRHVTGAGGEADVLGAASELLGFAEPAGLLCLARGSTTPTRPRDGRTCRDAGRAGLPRPPALLLDHPMGTVAGRRAAGPAVAAGPPIRATAGTGHPKEPGPDSPDPPTAARHTATTTVRSAARPRRSDLRGVHHLTPRESTTFVVHMSTSSPVCRPAESGWRSERRGRHGWHEANPPDGGCGSR